MKTKLKAGDWVEVRLNMPHTKPYLVKLIQQNSYGEWIVKDKEGNMGEVDTLEIIRKVK